MFKNLFHYSLKDFILSRPAVYLCSLALMINAGIWFLTVLKTNNQAEVIFLHYTIYFGVDLIGPGFKLYIIPLIGLLIFFFHLLFAKLFVDKGKSISNFILGTSIVFNLFLFLHIYLLLFQGLTL